MKMIYRRFYSIDTSRFQKASVNFYLISLLAYTIGSPINLVEYFRNSLWDFVILDIFSFVIMYGSFLLYLFSLITFKLNCILYVYTLLANLALSMWLYNAHNIDVTGNFLLNTFMYSINIAVAGFCINRKHSFYTAGMYIILIGPLLLITENAYLKYNAIFILFLIVSFSFALAEFLHLLERSFNEELAYKEEIYQKDQKLADQQNKFLCLELENKKKELVAKALFLLEYTENNNDFIKSLTAAKTQLNPADQKTLKSIIDIHRIDHHEKYWREFETSFLQIHDDFYKKLREISSELKSADLRLAAFIHLGMSSKQIATLTSNIPESIDVARSRLRSKLKLTTNENLKTFLQKI